MAKLFVTMRKCDYYGWLEHWPWRVRWLSDLAYKIIRQNNSIFKTEGRCKSGKAQSSSFCLQKKKKKDLSNSCFPSSIQNRDAYVNTQQQMEWVVGLTDCKVSSTALKRERRGWRHVYSYITIFPTHVNWNFNWSKQLWWTDMQLNRPQLFQ